MGCERAHMAFLDPPYNVRVRDIGGRGQVKHQEFAMASGEMSQSAFTSFLTDTLALAASVSIDGAVHFVCMDWRHIGELVEAGRVAYGAMLNLIAWVKSNAGQGSFYRSQHELIGVFRVGSSPHLNTIELGRHGRSRSNVWKYAGANTFRAGRMDDLRAHPTVKPVALVADAIKDCTHRNHLVLDTFCGSGTTLLAAERVGRQARALEIDPRYVDVAIRRWQAFTGRDAVHVDTGLTFDEMADGRHDRARARPPARPQVIAMARKNKGGGRRGDQFNDVKRSPIAWVAGIHPRRRGGSRDSQATRRAGARKAPSFSEVTEQVLNEKIEMRIGDRVLRMSNRQALVRFAIRQALAGKPRLLTVLPAIMRYESENLQGQGDADLNLAAADEAILADFLARHKSHRKPRQWRPNMTSTDMLSSSIAPLPVSTRRALFDAVLRSDLYAFVQAAFPIVAGGQVLQRNWHLEAMTAALTDVLNGKCRRLIITVPPRSLKSICASVALPAFALGQDPSRNIICVSYSDVLSRKHGNDCRALMHSPMYRRIFPRTRISSSKDTEAEIRTTAGGIAPHHLGRRHLDRPRRQFADHRRSTQTAGCTV